MDIDKMITQMTLEEKASLCSGKDFWHTKGLERFQVPAMMMCDGPHGLRKQVGEGDHLGLNESIETVCYPTASALASSFDRGMLRKLGEALGKECQQEDVGMLLGPGINMKRSPLCGRNFEYFSEDPYLAGEMGSAFVEGIQSEGVLTGAYNPSGKLPLTVARNAGQIPIYYNHPNGSAWHQGPSIGFRDYVNMPHTPRYFFGYGLSYTTFEYTDIHVDKESVKPADAVTVSVSVKNTGKVTGTEVVQMYLCDEQASMTRPVKELQGFARVSLAPGEKKKVIFTVHPSLMAFLDEEMRWKIEKGAFKVQIGASSEDIRQEERFTVEQDLYMEGKNRRFYAEAVIE